MGRYKEFDRGAIELKSLRTRGHRLLATECLGLPTAPPLSRNPNIASIAEAIRKARDALRPVILVMGAHLIKLGLSRYLIDVVQRGFVTHIATNGAGIIHDLELAIVGGTSEDVAKWIRLGQFGLWEETSVLNEVISAAASCGEGLGEGVGRYIEEGGFPSSGLSVAAACWRKGVPMTVHVTIGADIIHAMPNADGAALGQTSYRDFLICAESVSELEGGVFLNIGSAVTGPEVYLKALSMARNVARQRSAEIRHFTTAVFDLVDLPPNWSDGPPNQSDPGYYFRPWKTILCRTVADGGQSYYVKGDFLETIPALWQELVKP
jgi:hypothetical protein